MEARPTKIDHCIQQALESRVHMLSSLSIKPKSIGTSWSHFNDLGTSTHSSVVGNEILATHRGWQLGNQRITTQIPQKIHVSYHISPSAYAPCMECLAKGLQHFAVGSGDSFSSLATSDRDSCSTHNTWC